MPFNVYLKSVLEEIPRLLGLLNRNPMSENYGCFDRQYWHYKIIDTPSARCQEAALTLALLYTTPNNPYYQKEQILEWINASLEFWVKIQEKNGSFNEWYPHENSFVATAFSCYAISETLLIIKDSIKNKDVIIKSLIKSCDWLLSKKEKRVQNQEGGALIATYNLFLLTSKIKYKHGAKKQFRSIINSQTKEGWFYEYGGPDIGYLSLMIDYLSKYYTKSKDKTVLKALNKSIDFISYFVHPNLTFGGEYGSRNTEYLIPSGFEILAKENARAAAIAKCIRDSIKNKTTITLSSLDDRYLTYITYDWLQAYLNSNRLRIKKNRFEKNFSKSLGLAQIQILSNPKIYLIINYKKGGVFKLFFKKTKKAVYDGGILIETNKRLTSGFLVNANKVEMSQNSIKIIGRMSEIKDKTLTSTSTIALRIFQQLIGKNEIIGKFIKERLRDNLVTKNKQSTARFERRFSISNSKIEVIDIVSSKERIKKVITGTKFSHLYTPSSRYFQISELMSRPLVLKDLSSKKVKIIREYSAEGILITQRIVNNLN